MFILNLLGIDFEDWYHPQLIKDNLPPGKKFPHLFCKLSVTLESLSVKDYLSQFSHVSKKEMKKELCYDLEKRRDLHCTL